MSDIGGPAGQNLFKNGDLTTHNISVEQFSAEAEEVLEFVAEFLESTVCHATSFQEIDGTTQVSDMVEEGSVLDIERLRVAPTEELLETLVRGISVEWPLEEGILIGASESEERRIETLLNLRKAASKASELLCLNEKDSATDKDGKSIWKGRRSGRLGNKPRPPKDVEKMMNLALKDDLFAYVEPEHAEPMGHIMDMAVYQPDHAHMMQTSGHMDGVGSHIEYTDSADLNRRAQMEQQPHQQVEMRTGTTSFAQALADQQLSAAAPQEAQAPGVEKDVVRKNAQEGQQQHHQAADADSTMAPAPATAAVAAAAATTTDAATSATTPEIAAAAAATTTAAAATSATTPATTGAAAAAASDSLDPSGKDFGPKPVAENEKKALANETEMQPVMQDPNGSADSHMHLPQEEMLLDHSVVAHNDVVLSVAIFHAEKPTLVTQEFLVLGTQKLTELRDVIYCLSDTIAHEHGGRSPSGFFFIEGTFYSDMRHSHAQDYAQGLMKWIGENVNPQPKLQIKKMEETTFNELNIQVGKDYVYAHEGDVYNCLVFTDIRRIHPDEVFLANHYAHTGIINPVTKTLAYFPAKVFQYKPRKRACSVCQINLAKFVVYEDELSIELPSFWCEVCTKMRGGLENTKHFKYYTEI